MEIMIFLIQSTVIIMDFPSLCTARNFFVDSVVTHEALDYVFFVLFFSFVFLEGRVLERREHVVIEAQFKLL